MDMDIVGAIKIKDGLFLGDTAAASVLIYLFLTSYIFLRIWNL